MNNLSTVIRYSIVMTAFNRNRQLLKTLEGFKHHQYGADTEVIIVDDASVEPVDVRQSDYAFSVRVIRIEPSEKWYANPCVPFNRGLRAARGEVVIIQNAECYHLNNVITYLRSNHDQLEHVYFAFACYSLKQEESLSNSLESYEQFINSTAIDNGSGGWYNHSKYRPVAYHFCSAIRRDRLNEIGFFDETFARGFAFDDDELLYRIRRKLKVVIVDDCIVLHQWHYSGGGAPNQALLIRNRSLLKFHTKWGLPAALVVRLILPVLLWSKKLSGK